MEQPPRTQPKPSRQPANPWRQVLSYAWSWNVILFVVGVVGLAAWTVLLGMSEFDVANWVFIGSVLLLLMKLLTWAASKRPVATRNLLIVSSVVICGLVLFIETTWIKQKEAASVVAVARSQSQPAAPAIMASYKFGEFLPISIAPHSTVLIVQLHPNIVDGFYTETNGGDKPYTWPPQLKVAKSKSSLKDTPEQIVEYTFLNYGDKSVMNVSLEISVHFLEAKKHNLTKRYRKPDGQYTVEVPSGPTDGMSTEEYMSGELLSSHKHKLVIPAIEPKVPIRFYVVNQSRYFGKVFLPEYAKLRVAGDLEDKLVKLNRQQLNIIDRLPHLIIPPSAIPWIGLPDGPRENASKTAI